MPVTALGLLLWQSDTISSWVLGTSEDGRFFRILFVTLTFNLSCETPMAWLRVLDRSLTFTAINLVRLVCALSLNILFLVVYDMGVEGVLFSGLITAVLIAGICATICLRSVRFSPNRVVLRQLLAFGIPLIGGWLGSFLLNYSDRFFLKKYTTLADIGIYSLSYKLGMIPTIAVTMPFLMAWGPRQFVVARNEADPAGIFGKIFTYFAALHVMLVLGFGANSREIISIMASPEYAASALFIAPLMVAYAFQGVQQYSQFGLLLCQRTKYIGILVMVAAGVNIGLNAIFVPRYGVAGAAWTTVASFAVLIAMIVPTSQRFFAIRYELGRLSKLLAAAVVVGWATTRIDIDSDVSSLIAKSVLILVAIPSILWLLRFFHRSEIAALHSLWSRQRPD